MSAAIVSDSPASPPSGALEALFKKHHGMVFGVAYRVTGRADDAEDVLQTVFMRLMHRGDDLDLSPSPGGYLRRAAINAGLDLVRSRARKQAIPLDEFDAPSDAPGPEDSGQASEIRRCLRKALAALTPKSAKIFTLRFVEGLGNHEIASLTETSQTAIGVMVHRARNRVKKDMAACVGGLEHA